MKAKIDNDGILFMERAGIMKKQFCPWTTDGATCGDWCPKFIEPFAATKADVYPIGGLIRKPHKEQA